MTVSPKIRRRALIGGGLLALVAGAVGVSRVLRPRWWLRRPKHLHDVPVLSTGPDDAFTLVSVGDINLAEDVLETLERHGGHYQFEFLRQHVRGDALIGNLETAVVDTPTQPPLEGKTSIHIMKPKYLRTLADEGFTALALANNHIADQGAVGVTATWQHVKEHGMVPFGAGHNLDEARKAVLFDAGHTKVAVLSVQDWRRGLERLGWFATDNAPGCYGLAFDQLERDIQKLKAQGYLVVVSIHWGKNYVDEDAHQHELLRKMVAAGVDLINGHGAHRGQGVRVVDGVPVIYSLGNFTFGSKGVYKSKSPKMRLSAIARLHFKDGAIAGLQLLPIRTDNRRVKYKPRPPQRKQARKQFEPWLERYGLKWDRGDDGWYTLQLPENGGETLADVEQKAHVQAERRKRRREKRARRNASASELSRPPTQTAPNSATPTTAPTPMQNPAVPPS